LICRDEFDTFGYVEEEEEQQTVVDPSGLNLAARVVAQFNPGLDAEIDAAVNQCCIIEKIIGFIVIASMFFCFILTINILFSIARSFY